MLQGSGMVYLEVWPIMSLISLPAVITLSSCRHLHMCRLETVLKTYMTDFTERMVEMQGSLQSSAAPQASASEVRSVTVYYLVCPVAIAKRCTCASRTPRDMLGHDAV
jgi:uncharacterized membrane protein